MKTKATILSISALLLLAWTGYLLYRPAHALQSETRFMMGTYCRIDIPGNRSTRPAMNAAFARLAELDALLYSRKPGSPIHNFNTRNSTITNMEAITLVQAALSATHETGGAFDPTISPLIDLWGFYSEQPAVPAPVRLIEALSRRGTNGLALTDQGVVKLRPETQIDLGGIGQGFAISEAKRVLIEHGIQSALIDLGGDIIGFGTLHQRPWHIGIRHPRRDGLIERVSLSDKAIITSGDYEHFFEQDGIRRHHILDPSTGLPATGLVSVTLLMDDPIRCDAYSTGLFVMGMEKARQFLDAHPEVEAMLIAPDLSIYMTPGFKRLVLPSSPETR